MAILTRWCAWLLLASGCGFSPGLDGIYTCGADHACPPGLLCANDDVCRAIDLGRGSEDGAGPGEDASHATTDLAVCKPRSCGPSDCGAEPSGCGGSITCAVSCDGKGKQACGGGGPNRCGPKYCQPTTCAALGKTCGVYSDGCANVIDCGPCQS